MTANNVRLATAVLVAFGCAASIRSQPPIQARITIVPATSVFTVPATTYVLPQIPVVTANDVFLNGLLMLQGTDYTLIGSALTFTGQPVAQMAAPIIQVKYWVAQ